MELDDFFFTILNDSFDLSSFDCGDLSINDFLKNDVINYQIQQLANSYLFVDEQDKVKLYFSISNDSLNDLGENKGFDNKIWNRFHRKRIPNEKRIKQYPAVKIGRLGVDGDLQGKGLATQLIFFLKRWVLKGQKPACRLFVIDAYNQDKQMNFYIKNGFKFLLDKDVSEKTRIMYFDLLTLQ